MSDERNPLARAYQIARSGDYADLGDIARKLKSEGYEAVDAHLSGSGIRAELRKLWREAREKREKAPER